MCPKKRPLGRPRHRLKDITTELREIGWEGVDWMHLAQNSFSRILLHAVSNFMVSVNTAHLAIHHVTTVQFQMHVDFTLQPWLQQVG
jgi:hypothetical protein